MSLESNVFKVIVFGDTNVGKTTLVHKLVKEQFKENIQKTIGVEFRSKSVYVDNLQIKLQIWDFSGEERFNFLFEMYTKGVVGGIFVFDMTNFQSMLSLSKWVNRIRAYTKNDFPILIVGTKKDLSEANLEKRAPFLTEDFFFCSAKTGENVDVIFQTLAEKIYNSQK